MAARRILGDRAPRPAAAPDAQAVAELAELQRDAVQRATPIIENLAPGVRALSHDEYADRVARAFSPKPGRA